MRNSSFQRSYEISYNVETRLFNGLYGGDLHWPCFIVLYDLTMSSKSAICRFFVKITYLYFAYFSISRILYTLMHPFAENGLVKLSSSVIVSRQADMSWRALTSFPIKIQEYISIMKTGENVSMWIFLTALSLKKASKITLS